MSKAEEAAVAAANELLGESVEAEEESPSEPSEEAAVEEVQQEAAPVEIPPEVQAIYDEPEPEEEEPEEYEDEEEEQYAEYEDEDLAKERKKSRALEKKLKWMEDQSLKQNKPKWREEALKYTPYCEPFIDQIDATSRRAFLREAKRINDTVEAWASEKYRKPAEADTDALRAEIEAQVRQEYKDKGWGEITAGPSGAPAEAGEARAKLEKALKERAPLDQIVKLRAELGQLNNL